MRRTKWDDSTIEPTDIVKMQCNECGKWYTVSGNGLMINSKDGSFRPCVGMPANPLVDREKCESTDYSVYRRMEIRAMPIGRKFNDLSRKYS